MLLNVPTIRVPATEPGYLLYESPARLKPVAPGL